MDVVDVEPGAVWSQVLALVCSQSVSWTDADALTAALLISIVSLQDPHKIGHAGSISRRPRRRRRRTKSWEPCNILEADLGGARLRGRRAAGATARAVATVHSPSSSRQNWHPTPLRHLVVLTEKSAARNYRVIQLPIARLSVERTLRNCCLATSKASLTAAINAF